MEALDSAAFWLSRVRFWHSFDLASVGATLALSAPPLARWRRFVVIARLLRVMRFVAHVDELAVILTGLARGLRSTTSILALLLLVLFLFAIVGRAVFGNNDPGRFGSTAVAMLTMFQVATLADWTTVFNTAYYGCEEFPGGVYRRPRPERGESAGEVVWFATGGYGDFADFVCVEPKASITFSRAYFFAATMLTAFVVLSLFISVVSAGMFESRNEVASRNERRARRQTERQNQTTPEQRDKIRNLSFSTSALGDQSIMRTIKRIVAPKEEKGSVANAVAVALDRRRSTVVALSQGAALPIAAFGESAEELYALTIARDLAEMRSGLGVRADAAMRCILGGGVHDDDEVANLEQTAAPPPHTEQAQSRFAR